MKSQLSQGLNKDIRTKGFHKITVVNENLVLITSRTAGRSEFRKKFLCRKADFVRVLQFQLKCVLICAAFNLHQY